MSYSEQVIENPIYAGMSLKELLESANLFDWKDLKGAEGKLIKEWVNIALKL